MADGCAEMIFHYQTPFDEIFSEDKIETSFHSGLHGQSQNFRRFIVRRNFGIFGVYLYPFALPFLFSIPSDELSNEMPDLPTLMGNEGKILEEKIMLAETNEKRVEIISGFLEKKIARNYRHEPAVFSTICNIIETNGIANVQQMAEQSFLSTRQFERKFKAFSGFSPKLYSRIVRFQSTLNMYGDSEKSLTEIAYECGYYDQSHFIHDFKEFSGQHPRFFFSGKAEGAEYRDK
ncbi:AraC family transcriptional regulator [Dyadobacter frigoris]|nr:AraC family transcriptional regulator [Dyadobacter frigoris]